MELSRRKLLKAGGATLGAAVSAPKVTATPAEDQFILDVGETVSDRDVVAAQRSGLEVVRRLDPIGFLTVKGDGATVRELGYDWVKDLMLERDRPAFNSPAPSMRTADVDPSDAAIEEATPDSGHFTPPADYVFQWDKITQGIPEAMRTADGSGRKVAVIDTGVFTNHPNLNVDETNSRNMTTDDPDSWYTGSGSYHDAGPWGGSHGTHVAGIAAANGNTVTYDGETHGTVGTAPGAEVVSYRIFSGIGGSAGVSATAEAIIDAADVGCDSVNLSIGYGTFLPLSRGGAFGGIIELIKAILSAAATYARERGTVVVNSAGNSSTNLDQPGIAPLSEADNVVTVSATGPIGYSDVILPGGDGELDEPVSTAAVYTNLGNGAIDLAAHGGNADLSLPPFYFLDLVYNTYVTPDVYGSSPDPNLTFEVDHGWLAGTSMASPQVAGAIALVRDANPEWTPQDVFDVLSYTAETASAGGFQPVTHGNGQIRPDRAVVADLSDLRTGSGRDPESGRGPSSGRGSGRGGEYCNGETRGSSETDCSGGRGAGGGRSSGGSDGRGRGSGRGDAGSRG